MLLFPVITYAQTCAIEIILQNSSPHGDKNGIFPVAADDKLWDM